MMYFFMRFCPQLHPQSRHGPATHQVLVFGYALGMLNERLLESLSVVCGGDAIGISYSSTAARNTVQICPGNSRQLFIDLAHGETSFISPSPANTGFFWASDQASLFFSCFR